MMMPALVDQKRLPHSSSSIDGYEFRFSGLENPFKNDDSGFSSDNIRISY